MYGALRSSKLSLSYSREVADPKQRSQLEPIAGASKLHILHFRFSGSEKAHRNIRDEILLQLCRRYTCCSNAIPTDQNFRPTSCGAGASDFSTSLYDHSYDSFVEELDGFGISDKPSATNPEAEELVNFADWAFGPCGLPALQILAFGDFSFEGRYQKQQLLMHRKCGKRTCIQGTCRDLFCDNTSGCNFCVADVAEWDSIQVHGSNFLSVCPESGLMESPYE